MGNSWPTAVQCEGIHCLSPIEVSLDALRHFLSLLEKYIQLIIVIKSPSGVSDKIVLNQWSKIFHYEPYSGFVLEAWKNGTKHPL